MTVSIVTSDCIEFNDSQEENSVDLVLGSPPYGNQRTYGIDAVYTCQEWVDWMLKVTTAAVRVSKGLVLWVVSGNQIDNIYQPFCEGLCWEWWKAGNHLWRPCIWWKVDENNGGTGIPGSGGKQWLRNDWEYVLAFKKAGWLPWSDNTAMGHEPVFDQCGGVMSNRTPDGRRINQRVGERLIRSRTMDVTAGHDKDGNTGRADGRPMPKIANPGNVLADLGKLPLRSLNIIDIMECYEQLTKDNSGQTLRSLRDAIDAKDLSRWWSRIYSRIHEEAILQSHLQRSDASIAGWTEVWRSSASRKENCAAEESEGEVREMREDESPRSPPSGSRRHEQPDGELGSPLSVVPPEGTQDGEMFNSRVREEVLRPGVLFDALPKIQDAWRSIAETIEARNYPAERGQLIAGIVKARVGGGHMGSKLCHFSEAPFPEDLAEFFILSFCPPNGTVLDCFSGSGTVASVARRHQRNFTGCDVRQSQVDLSLKRLANETPMDLFNGAEYA